MQANFGKIQKKEIFHDEKANKVKLPHYKNSATFYSVSDKDFEENKYVTEIDENVDEFEEKTNPTSFYLLHS